MEKYFDTLAMPALIVLALGVFFFQERSMLFIALFFVTLSAIKYLLKN
jgi:hypothetical protein